MQGINKYFELNDVHLNIKDFKKDNDYITVKNQLNDIKQSKK